MAVSQEPDQPMQDLVKDLGSLLISTTEPLKNESENDNASQKIVEKAESRNNEECINVLLENYSAKVSAILAKPETDRNASDIMSVELATHLTLMNEIFNNHLGNTGYLLL